MIVAGKIIPIDQKENRLTDIGSLSEDYRADTCHLILNFGLFGNIHFILYSGKITHWHTRPRGHNV
jgi:hypothetical protein